MFTNNKNIINRKIFIALKSINNNFENLIRINENKV